MNGNQSFACALIIAALAFSSAARAEDFATTLVVSDGVARQEAATQPAKVATARRTVMECKAGVVVTAGWKLVSTAKAPIKDVLVHFYVVKIDRLGQPPPPLDPRQVIVESALTMDFDVGSTTHANLDFRPDHEGIYLVRIEAEQGTGAESSVSFKDLDLVVKR